MDKKKLNNLRENFDNQVFNCSNIYIYLDENGEISHNFIINCLNNKSNGSQNSPS
jgi:hypothetical protein